MFAHTTSFSSSGGPSESSSDLSFRASGSRLAVLFTSQFFDADDASFGRSLRAGPLGRPVPLADLNEVDECSDYDPESGPGLAFALDGDFIAFDDTACASDGPVTPSVAIQDLVSGARRSITQPPDTFILRLESAGEYLAVLRKGSGVDAPGALVVYGAAGPDEVLNVPIADPAKASYALQDDGTLAVCSAGKLEWRSPSEPQPHVIGTCGRVASIAGDRILGQENDLLKVTTLAGDPRTIARIGGVPSAGFDSDAAFAYYALRKCDRHWGILRLSLDATAGGLPYVRCPASVRTRRIGVGKRGGARLAMECPRGCAGSLRVVARGRSVGYAAFRRRAGRSFVRLRLNPRGRQLARRSDAVRGRVLLQVDDRTGKPQRFAKRIVL